MIIKRGRRAKNFTIIGNEIFDDARLQEELGVLVYLLSRPDDWRISTEQLRNRFGYGRDKIQRILGSLREYGYARIDNTHDRETGRIVARAYVVFDEPQSSISGVHEPENQGHGDDAPMSLKNRLTEKPSHGKSGDIQRTESLPRTESNQPPNPQGGTGEGAPPAADDWPKFVEAWRFDDPTEGRGFAVQAFARLTEAERAEAIRAAPLYRTECERRERKRKFATTWIRDKGWQAFAAAETVVSVFIPEGSEAFKAWDAFERSQGRRCPAITMTAGRGTYRRTMWPPGDERNTPKAIGAA